VERSHFATMWPFKKKARPVTQTVPTEQLSFSQLDITETFDDHLRLKPDDWIATVPLNKTVADGQSMGLPPSTASAEEAYEVAAKLSRLRESVPIPNDGVYCPICHIANIELAKLHSPCPRCARPLLKFGWD
jgi:hypothetical protein